MLKLIMVFQTIHKTLQPQHIQSCHIFNIFHSYHKHQNMIFVQFYQQNVFQITFIFILYQQNLSLLCIKSTRQRQQFLTNSSTKIVHYYALCCSLKLTHCQTNPILIKQKVQLQLLKSQLKQGYCVDLQGSKKLHKRSTHNSRNSKCTKQIPSKKSSNSHVHNLLFGLSKSKKNKIKTSFKQSPILLVLWNPYILYYARPTQFFRQFLKFGAENYTKYELCGSLNYTGINYTGINYSTVLNKTNQHFYQDSLKTICWERPINNIGAAQCQLWQYNPCKKIQQNNNKKKKSCVCVSHVKLLNQQKITNQQLFKLYQNSPIGRVINSYQFVQHKSTVQNKYYRRKF
eukprot:TRINITY_DN8947_c0_g2_i2.p1 TRINITY_DN8947_c0_g2~~TRINITY_DN8947_c0_g2_i2.p1  ORF type:complete len:344 (-),score=-39.77 TRINITY_DN8947_c0_g2_i2:142-1173(-)